MGENEKDLRIYKLRDEEMKEYVSNLVVYEFNMDYYKKLWYSNDKEKIEEYKYIIMQDLELEDLEKLSKNEKVVGKYMEEIKKVNEEPEFREFVTAEQDNLFIENSIKYYAKQEGREEGREEAIEETAKKMKEDNLPIDNIMKYTSLTEEQINSL